MSDFAQKNQQFLICVYTNHCFPLIQWTYSWIWHHGIGMARARNHPGLDGTCHMGLRPSSDDELEVFWENKQKDRNQTNAGKLSTNLRTKSEESKIWRLSMLRPRFVMDSLYVVRFVSFCSCCLFLLVFVCFVSFCSFCQFVVRLVRFCSFCSFCCCFVILYSFLFVLRHTTGVSKKNIFHESQSIKFLLCVKVYQTNFF